MARRFLLALAASALFATAACGGLVESSDGSQGGGGPAPTSTTTPAPTGTSITTPVPSPEPAPAPGPGPTPAPAPGPSPVASWNASANGCGNFVVYTSDPAGLRWLVIQASREELGLTKVGDSGSIDLSAPVGESTSTSVVVDSYAAKPQWDPYCDDIAGQNVLLSKDKAVSGVITFTVTSTPGNFGETYTISVSVSGVAVQHADGSVESMPDARYSDITVGWFAG